jgi:hypothetical protein
LTTPRRTVNNSDEDQYDEELDEYEYESWFDRFLMRLSPLEFSMIIWTILIVALIMFGFSGWAAFKF